MQVITLDSLRVPGMLDEFGRADASRRMLTLTLPNSGYNKSGGTCKVIKAFNRNGEVMCIKALKPLRDTVSTYDRRLDMFFAQSRMLEDEFFCQSTLSDLAGIPSAYGLGSYAGGPLLLMEWIDGAPLRNLLRLRPQSYGIGLDACAVIGASVAGLLLEARRRDPSFVHRDLSGLNVLLQIDTPLRQQLDTCQFNIRLIDFGSAISSRLLQNRQHAGQHSKRIWRNATPEYAPPEMLTTDPAYREQRNSPLIDVYALSSVLYELYYAHTPYTLMEARAESAFHYKISHRPEELHRGYASDKAFLGLLMHGLQPRQSDRPSLEDLYRQLLAICKRQRPETAYQLAQTHERALEIAGQRRWHDMSYTGINAR